MPVSLLSVMAGTLVFLLVLGLVCKTADGDYADLVKYLTQQAQNQTFVRLFEDHLKKFQDTSEKKLAVAPFACKSFPSPKGPPVSVHELSPADVKVVGAIGDSITAGTGISANTVIGLLWENRGKSWSIGGDGDITEYSTLPNMLKIFNPNLKGYALNGGPVWLPDSHFNVADPGAKSEEMLNQAEMLVARMKEDSSVDFKNDWKIITVFVGGNDLCDFCQNKEAYSAENYIANVQSALDYFHDNVPRAFINLVEVLDISIVKKLNEGLICEALHYFTCACAAFPKDSEEEAALQEVTKQYRTLTQQLAESGRYDTREDFTVVAQPFFTETQPPNQGGTDSPDLSYFAPDCFHLSVKGHQAAADALWNNMIEPVGSKRLRWTPGEPVECPSESEPYFYTYKNSPNHKMLGSRQGPVNGEMTDGWDKIKGSSSHIPSVMPGLIAGICLVAFLAFVGMTVYRRYKRPPAETKTLLPPTNDTQA